MDPQQNPQQQKQQTLFTQNSQITQLQQQNQLHINNHIHKAAHTHPTTHPHLHSHQKSSSHHKHHKNGGLSSIPIQQILVYLQRLTFTQSYRSAQWNKSIKQLNQLIQSTPVLRMNFQHSLSQCHKTLPNFTIHQLLTLINTAINTPPMFSSSQLIGCPINCIFVQFMQNQNGRAFFQNYQVNQKLKNIMKDYNEMLQSERSLEFMNEKGPHGWFSEEAKKQINYDLYVCDKEKNYYGFKNWNQWFLRRFKEGIRIIGIGKPQNVRDDLIIVNACESTPLGHPIQPVKNIKLQDKFWLKDDCYSLLDMFSAHRHQKHHLAQYFQHGTVYQAFLSALFYHRWHSPVDGVIEDIYQIQGTYYLDNSQFIPYDQGSPNNSQHFLTAVATRKIIIINTHNENIGKIAIIFIGMSQVSSCVQNVKIGEKVRKGQDIGHFAFGGSSHVIVFNQNVKLRFNDKLYEVKDGQFIPQKQQLHSFQLRLQWSELFSVMIFIFLFIAMLV